MEKGSKLAEREQEKVCAFMMLSHTRLGVARGRRIIRESKQAATLCEGGLYRDATEGESEPPTWTS
jgi:hypothetical protein